MSFPRYCIIGSRAVKAIPQPDGELEVVAYYADDDEFRGAVWALDRLDSGDSEEVTEEEFDRYVERQRAEARADPEGQRRRRLDKLRYGRQMIIEAVRRVDPTRADALDAAYASGGEDVGAEQRRTQRLMGEVAGIPNQEVRVKVAMVESITNVKAPGRSG